MRRRTFLGLAALGLLVVLLGTYAAYWLIAAGQVKDGFSAWAEAQRARKVDISWARIDISGFPLAYRVDLEKAVLHDGRVTPSPELRIPLLAASARPWDFANWQLTASDGIAASLAGAGERPPLKAVAKTAAGVLRVGESAGAALWLRLREIEAEAGARVPISSADVWITLPPNPSRSPADPGLGLAVDLRQIQLPGISPVLGDEIDQLAFAVTVKGAFPGGKLAEAASAWRDAGGTIELGNLQLKSHGLSASATGTIALDGELQPVGGISGAIEGYDQILAALVENGHLRASDAGLARLALAMLAKAGPDGKPMIATAFRIQNGQMFLGPAKLGRAPRIAWQ
ncbi:MAG: DUF2125 domain-containing protein [Alphaproteobacteria bacterium]|nr:DUF2125 domain-containing protein [Alphaproteobacteria bacterium]